MAALSSQKKNIKIIREGGIIWPLVKTLKLEDCEAHVQAANALVGLSVDKTCREEIMRFDGVFYLVKMLAQSNDDGKIAASCALFRLSRSLQIQRMIVHEGGIQVI